MANPEPTSNPATESRMVRRCAIIAHSLVAVLAVCLLAGPATASVRERPRIDAVFVLDTTGSMGGLIEGAKRKIWSIADQIASAKNEPQVRMGLVAYRDRGDDYVTRISQLSSDLDGLYASLRELRAGGGGDGPESVNAALHSAVDEMAWSPGSDVYRVIFLVGDAPPHMDYQDDVRYRESIALASRRGIVVNTIQCGNDPTTRAVWKEIAGLSDGEFVAIAGDGGMVALETPYDAELKDLQAKVADTVVPYGSSEERARVGAKVRRSAEAEAPMAAARLSYMRKSRSGAVSGGGDLLDALEKGETKLQDVPAEALPSALADLDEAGREEVIEQKLVERKQLDGRIGELVAKRDAFVRDELRRQAAQGRGDGFDQKVVEAIREQGAKSGIVFGD